MNTATTATPTEMKPEIERAMREVLEAWEKLDSPEALALAIYQMKRVYVSHMMDALKREKAKRIRKKRSTQNEARTK